VEVVVGVMEGPHDSSSLISTSNLSDTTPPIVVAVTENVAPSDGTLAFLIVIAVSLRVAKASPSHS
jgi:hypothetical protein